MVTKEEWQNWRANNCTQETVDAINKMIADARERPRVNKKDSHSMIIDNAELSGMIEVALRILYFIENKAGDENEA